MVKKENKEELMDNIIKNHVCGLLFYTSYLNLNFNEFKEVLAEISIFEKKINFSSKFDDIVYDSLNWFILNDMFNSAVIFLKLFIKTRDICILQKIYSKITHL